MTQKTNIEPRGPVDHLPRGDLEEKILSWVAETTDDCEYKWGDTEDAYLNLVTPRCIFVKTLPPNSALLDLGAGNGSLIHYKTWPDIQRTDLRYFGVSLDWQDNFVRYEHVEIGDFMSSTPNFGHLKFDGIMSAHFIEHIPELTRCIDYIADSIANAGRVYIEWPHEASQKFPPASKIRELGLNASTSNFFDDKTHSSTWSMDEVARSLEQRGFIIEALGRPIFPFLADKMRDAAKKSGDTTLATLSVWYKFGEVARAQARHHVEHHRHPATGGGQNLLLAGGHGQGR